MATAMVKGMSQKMAKSVSVEGEKNKKRGQDKEMLFGQPVDQSVKIKQ